MLADVKFISCIYFEQFRLLLLKKKKKKVGQNRSAEFVLTSWTKYYLNYTFYRKFVSRSFFVNFELLWFLFFRLKKTVTNCWVLLTVWFEVLTSALCSGAKLNRYWCLFCSHVLCTFQWVRGKLKHMKYHHFNPIDSYKKSCSFSTTGWRCVSEDCLFIGSPVSGAAVRCFVMCP